MNMKTEEEITQMAIDAVNNLKACKRDNKGAYGDGFIAGYTACQDEDRWVPVSERLPESNDMHQSDYVICIDYLGTGSTPFVAWFDYGYEAWTVAHHNANDEPVTVTHWSPMVPLPNPPKK